jgi:ribosomal protein S18 acetylase RimI-like enzyme
VILDEIVIIELEPDRWWDFRCLRLDALRMDPDAFGARLEDEEVRPASYWKARLRDAQLRQNAWLSFAEQNGKLVGMVGAFVIEQSEDVMLIAMWVRPDVRGRGVARRLVQSQIDSVRSSRPDLSGMQLRVHTTQPVAIRLYESIGFRFTKMEGRERTMLLSFESGSADSWTQRVIDAVRDPATWTS